jgi:hypothetical protein
LLCRGRQDLTRVRHGGDDGRHLLAAFDHGHSVVLGRVELGVLTPPRTATAKPSGGSCGANARSANSPVRWKLTRSASSQPSARRDNGQPGGDRSWQTSAARH